MRHDWPSRGRGQKGFTLIEVILAIGLTIGLMFVVLYFYEQMSRLRRDVLSQTERVTSARLLLERLTRELRSARPDSFLLLGLRGTSNSIEFVSTVMPLPVPWRATEEGQSPVMFSLPSDLKIIRYRAAFGAEMTNAIGVTRAEEGLLELPPNPESGQATAPPPAQLLSDQLKFFQLRYWDGLGWVDRWNGTSLPAGVEVTLGPEAPPAEAMVDEEIELYRRVIYLPGSGRAPSVASRTGSTPSPAPLEEP